MFVSLAHPKSPSRKWKAIAAVAVAVGVVATGTLVATAADKPSTFAAQGGRWDRAADVNKSPYILKTPNVGSGTDRGQPLNYGVVAWQRLLNSSGANIKVDGAFGPKSQAAVREFQRSRKIEPSGVIGYPTAKALLDGMVNKHAKRVGMPTSTLMCHLAAESNLDPSAVGINGSDLGIAQISLPHNPGVTTDKAFDVEFAVKYMADRDARAFKTYKDWNMAIVSYNSPVAANQWKSTGVPNELATKYSSRVMGGC